MTVPEQASWRKSLGKLSFRRGAAAQEPTQEQKLAQLSEMLTADAVSGLESTGEVQPGCPAELEITLLRFLRAEGWDVPKAHARLLRHIQWRHTKQPLAISLSDEGVAGHAETGKSLLQPAGRKGRPLLIALGRLHLPSEYAAFERYLVLVLEAASHQCWGAANSDNKMWIMVDLSGLALKNLDASALRACFAVLHGHYPERAAGIIMYKAPAIFWGLWAIVKPFIHPDTRSKIKFVDGDKAAEVLDECVGLDIVPKEYGGQAEAALIQEAVAALAPRQAAAAAAGEAPAPVPAGEAAEAEALPRTCRQCAGECSCGWAERAVVAVAAA